MVEQLAEELRSTRVEVESLRRLLSPSEAEEPPSRDLGWFDPDDDWPDEWGGGTKVPARPLDHPPGGTGGIALPIPVEFDPTIGSTHPDTAAS